jgi:hypothetical protein
MNSLKNIIIFCLTSIQNTNIRTYATVYTKAASFFVITALPRLEALWSKNAFSLRTLPRKSLPLAA